MTLRVYTPDPEMVIQDAMLCCRNLWPDLPYSKNTIVKRIEQLHKSGHVGIFEHASATFIVQGVSRVMSHQAVRHRIGISYAQLSQRAYPTNVLDVIAPPEIRNKPEVYQAFVDLMKESDKFFILASQRGVDLEDSRFGALNATETQLFITATFQAWLHFLRLRLDPSAQWEIRAAAEEIWRQLREIAPNVFDPKYREYWK